MNKSTLFCQISDNNEAEEDCAEIIKLELSRLENSINYKYTLVTESLDGFESVKQYTKKIIESNKIKTIEEISNLAFEYDFGSRTLDAEKEFQFMILYLKQSEYYLSTKKISPAIRALMDSYTYLGRLQLRESISLREEAVNKAQKNRSKGGLARKKKYEPIYKFFAELIESERPIDGWKTRVDAANKLAIKLEKYIDKNHSPNGNPLINPINLRSHMTSWFSKIAIVKKAYENNCRAK